MIEKEVSFHASDGILKGTLRIPTEKITKMSLLVHGITVNREEDGFYTELAKRLSSIGTASLRFDLPGHGSSQGSYEKLTLTKVISAIDSAYKEICTNLLPNDFPLSIIASSFGGGLSACCSAKAFCSCCSSSIQGHHPCRPCHLHQRSCAQRRLRPT